MLPPPRFGSTVHGTLIKVPNFLSLYLLSSLLFLLKISKPSKKFPICLAECDNYIKMLQDWAKYHKCL